LSRPRVPAGLDPQLNRYLQGLEDSVSRLEPNRDPIDAPTNVVITPIAGGNQIVFTRAQNADGYLLRISPTPGWDAVTGMQRDLGDSNVAEDITGAVGITRYYSLVSYRGALQSVPTTPASATSLAPGAAATLPTPPPSSHALGKSDELQRNVAVEPHGQGALR
jgi:hypothetical protein